MSAPFFPPPQKKESAPFRSAAIVAPVVAAPARGRAAAEEWPELREPRARADAASEREPKPAPASSFLATFAWRFGVRVLSLAIVVGALYGLVWAHEGGAKWQELVIVVIGALGILASPFVLFWRLRRIWRFLFARDEGG